MKHTERGNRNKVIPSATTAFVALLATLCVASAHADGYWVQGYYEIPANGPTGYATANSTCNFSGSSTPTLSSIAHYVASTGEASETAGGYVTVTLVAFWDNADNKTPTPDHEVVFSYVASVSGGASPPTASSASSSSSMPPDATGTPSEAPGGVLKGQTSPASSGYAPPSADGEAYKLPSSQTYEEEGSLSTAVTAGPDWSSDPSMEGTPNPSISDALASLSISAADYNPGPGTA